MPDFKHLNLKDDVENMSEKFGLAPQMEARFGRNALGVQNGGFSYQKMAPNFRAPVAHRHKEQEEVYVVIAGGGRIKIEDEIQDVRQWDVLRFAPSVARAFEAGPDGLELIAIGYGESGDSEMLEDFWEDDASS